MTGGAEAQVELSDGRKLGYAEWGPDGPTLAFALHGQPGYRKTWLFPEDELLAAGVRIVTVDRPGVGLSDPKRGRTLLDFADDLAELADRLGVGPVPVIGWSSGAPYAAACAYARPERFNRLIVIAGVPPLEGGRYKSLPIRPLFALARWFPPALSASFALLGQMVRRDPDRTLKRVKRVLAAPGTAEEQFVHDPALHDVWVDLLAVSTQAGGRCWVEDYRLFVRDWGFALEDVGVPTDVWQGEDDIVIPPHAGRIYADAITGAELHLVPGHGHFVSMTRPREILAPLVD